jgi:hypothetical protein
MTKNIFGSQPEGGSKNRKIQFEITARCEGIFMRHENKEMEARDKERRRRGVCCKGGRGSQKIASHEKRKWL